MLCKQRLVHHHFGADTNESIDALLLNKLRHFCIVSSRVLPNLKNIRKNKRFGRMLLLLLQEVYSNFQSSEVGIVTVIDDGTIVNSFYQLQTHGHRYQFAHEFSN